jgi:hypothetical protein
LQRTTLDFYLSYIIIIGSKWHITNQCVYFAFKTIVFFEVFFYQKIGFPKQEISNEMFWNVLYIEFIVTPICHLFLQSNLEKYRFLKVHRFCEILCFIFKICHNFKSYQNMLTLSSLIFCIIRYDFKKTKYTLHHN